MEKFFHGPSYWMNNKCSSLLRSNQSKLFYAAQTTNNKSYDTRTCMYKRVLRSRSFSKCSTMFVVYTNMACMTERKPERTRNSIEMEKLNRKKSIPWRTIRNVWNFRILQWIRTFHWEMIRRIFKTGQLNISFGVRTLVLCRARPKVNAFILLKENDKIHWASFWMVERVTSLAAFSVLQLSLPKATKMNRNLR